MPRGFVSFERKVLPLEYNPTYVSYPEAEYWAKSTTPLCSVQVKLCYVRWMDFQRKTIWWYVNYILPKIPSNSNMDVLIHSNMLSVLYFQLHSLDSCLYWRVGSLHWSYRRPTRWNSWGRVCWWIFWRSYSSSWMSTGLKMLLPSFMLFWIWWYNVLKTPFYIGRNKIHDESRTHSWNVILASYG